MSDTVAFFRQYEYGNPSTGENYLRVEFGYFKSQFYISGFFNNKYFSVLFEEQDSNTHKVLLVLSGEGSVVKFKKGDEVSKKDILKWFETLISEKQKRAFRVLKAFLGD